MSGLGDLASWALGGVGAGAGDAADTGEAGGEGQDGQANANTDALTPQEMREQRLARMEAQQKKQQQQADEPKPMDIDEKPAAAAASSPKNDTPVKMDVDSDDKKKGNAKTSLSSPSKKKAKESHSPADPARKAQKRSELLLKKILSISLVGTSTTSDTSCVVIDIDDTAVTVQTIAEILATRLSLAPNAKELRTMPSQKGLIPYLAQCHRRAAEEIKNMKQSASSGSSSSIKAASNNPELLDILEEIKRQVVSYASSSLMVPELFELGQDAPAQLAKCFTANVTDLASSITFGVAGSASSFYYMLCEELLSSDKEVFDRVIGEIVKQLTKQLSKMDSVLDAGDGTDGSALVLVTALTSLCVHKKAAEVVTELPFFLLPVAGSAQAKETVTPPPPAGNDLMSRLLGLRGQTYLKRSGPALDKGTVLGLCLRPGIPRLNSAFGNARMSANAVEQTTNSQRQQLRAHQEACNQLVMALIKAGPDARSKVIRWFQDALLVNVGASGQRPDQAKVSSPSTLVNSLVILLKLCEPFVGNEKKQHLIDTGFISSLKDNGGVYATEGDEAVPRLGEANADAMATEYAPKNAFIPQCFFLCARFINLGYAPQFASQTQLMRHLQHMHWEAHNNNRSLDGDDQYLRILTAQRSQEVWLFHEDLVTDSLRFCNLMSRILFDIDDASLRLMPEHFVSDTCDIIMGVAKLKAKALRGLDFRYVFKLYVKLLSPKYSEVVRNYNLRAQLGDVMHDIFLPSASDDRRDVPSSVACDPMAGGQTFLLSDTAAQESLAPSLLLLYGEVEHTGYYEKMTHRSKIASLIKYLWESSEHRPAFRRITQNKDSFIKFANGIMNETNTLIATVMQKLPEIREAQVKMKNTAEWGQLGEEQQGIISARLEENEREVKHALPLCNKTLQMFGYLNTDREIRSLFLLDELCNRLVGMLLHVLTKLVGSKGLDLKVENPEQYDFRPKEMLRDLCAIFALFASSKEFQLDCAKSGCDPALLSSAVKTCRRLNLLTGESMTAFGSLPNLVAMETQNVAADEALLEDAPEEFLDEILQAFMKDPVILPSGHFVDRSTIKQQLLNDPIDPFNREPMTIADVKPATELKEKMDKWVAERRAAREASNA